MTVIEKPMYWAKCDYPGCVAVTSDYDTGNGHVYDSPERLDDEFTRKWEGTLADDYGWLRVGGKHYCGDHVEWDDSGDVKVPMREVAS
jgi:hypothetical protein